MKKTTISIVIPVFNQEEYIDRCVESLKIKKHGKYQLQVIFVDDGSTDESAQICKNHCANNNNCFYLYQENSGVSAARNLGIRHSIGKYIFFLDADDCLAPNTIERVSKFFDSVYEETDLVTYPIETIYQGRILDPHFRYKYLKKSGVYDLKEFPYIGQTTMNIVVKNQFENNILFDERQTFSEDQKYCCDVLHEKLKMGFCKDGKYIYYRSPDSTSGTLSGSCFIFEQCVSFFEQLFSRYIDVPLAFQGLYVNDIYWKMASNILFPYHYDKDEYEHAIDRMTKLLRRCDWRVVINHPQIDFFEKYYLLRWMGKDTLQCHVDSNCFALVKDEETVLSEHSMEMVITKVFVQGNEVEIYGFLKTVFFQFYDELPTLCTFENDGKLIRKLSLYQSSHCYYQSHEKTQVFYAMRYKCNIQSVKKLNFRVEVGGYWFPVHYYFMPRVPFSHKYKQYTYYKDNVHINIAADNSWNFEYIENIRAERTWLYYDCKGVAADNGMHQFLHDIKKNDDITRYYIVSDERQKEAIPSKSQVVFGSGLHKNLLTKAEKVITAYIEDNNIFPYEYSELEEYSNQFRFEIIYLQHGVLHIDMPWKYSPEKIAADWVVVSTEQEAALLMRNGFFEENLWKYKMPRFEMQKAGKQVDRKVKKILFAPSWRNYLTSGFREGKWQVQERKFLNSSYYRSIFEFIHSSTLEALLDTYGYTLEIKLHPIFMEYENCFETNNSTIKVVDSIDRVDEYSLFITDFSSYLYDFLYAEIPVISFVPDIIEFKSGMNGYRKLNYGEDFWNNVSVTSDSLIKKMEDALRGNYRKCIIADFINEDDSREKIYQRLSKTDNY